MKLKTIFIFLVVNVLSVISGPVIITNQNGIQSSVGSKPQFLLNGQTFPVSYELLIKTNIHQAQYEYEGTVKIVLSANEPTQIISLNSKDLDIKRVLVNSDALTVDDFEIDAVNEMLHITTPTIIGPGANHVLEIEYSGWLQNGTSGFYRSSYQNELDETVWLAATRFQPTEARTTFPCYDEPQYRATFKIQIIHGDVYRALSNMNGVTIPVGTNLLGTSFDETPPMPTYLVVFVISDFVETLNTENRITHSVYTPSNRKDDAAYALTTGVSTWEYFENYFGIDYELAKLDQIAIPDHQFGGMESWGLITYRPDFLLINDGSTLIDYENVATTIAHEYAHNYFGNLVTLKWWSYLWLNEGFASFYEYYAAHKITSEFRLDELFVVEVLQNVFWRDSFTTTIPIQQDVTNPTEISSAFNGIVYNKGGSVIRMMHHAITESIFVEGLSNYLGNYSLMATEPQNLYDHLQEVAGTGINVADIMKSWIEVPGYPVLMVERNYAANSIILTQKRFSMELPQEEEVVDESKWWIPVNFVTESVQNFDNTSPFVWFDKAAPSVTILQEQIQNFTTNDWIIFNVQQTGFYRVNYDETNWNRIIKHLDSDKFDEIIPINRAQLIDDSWSLSRADELDFKISFNLIEYLVRETDIIPWISANEHLEFFFNIFKGETLGNRVDEFARHLVRKIYEKLGTEEIENESRSDKRLRPLIIHLACRTGITDCLGKTATIFKSHLSEEPIEISPDLQTEIFCGGLRTATTAEFLSFWRKAVTSTNENERKLMMAAIPCIENAEQVESILMTAFYDSTNEYTYWSGEGLQLINGILKNSFVSLSTAIEFFMKHGDEMLGSASTRPRMVQAILNLDVYITTTAHFDLYDKLLSKIAGYTTESNIELSLKAGQRNLDWVELNRDRVKRELDNHLNGSAASLIISIQLVLVSIFITRNI